MTDININPSNERFQRRLETIALIDHLKSQPTGQAVTYEEMSAAAYGINVQYKDRHLLESAVKSLWNDGIYYRNIHGVGIERISAADAVRYSRGHHKKRLVNDTARFRGKLEAVDPSRLAVEDRTSYHLAIAECAIRESITSKGAERALEQHVSQKPAQSLGLGKDQGESMVQAFLNSGVVG